MMMIMLSKIMNQYTCIGKIDVLYSFTLLKYELQEVQVSH